MASRINATHLHKQSRRDFHFFALRNSWQITRVFIDRAVAIRSNAS